MRISLLGPGCGDGEIGDAVRRTDLAMVRSDPGQLRRVCEQIGRALAMHEGAPVIAVRSAVPPGTMREVVVPVLEQYSGKKAGEEFGVCFNPELLQDGAALIGELNRASGEVLATFYTDMRLIRVDLDTAEMVKHADDAWRALKRGFANEIGVLCKALGVDAHRVMESFGKELKPGLAFPKDVLSTPSLPILGSILPSYQRHLERAVQAVLDKGNRKVGLLGMEEPIVEVAQRLIGKGFDLRVYDCARSQHLTHLRVGSIDELLSHAQTIVIGRAASEFADVVQRIRDGQTIIDLARACDSRTIVGVYEGLCW